MEQTIFWVLFETENSKHDRIERFDTPQTKSDFWNWLIIKREEIENLKGKTCVMINCGII